MEGCGGEWFGMPVPRLFLCVGALHPIRRQCTSSVRVHRHVTGAPPHIGCSAPDRVQCPRACGSCVGCRGCGRLLGLSCPLGLSSAWAVFCLGCLLLGSLWRLMLWFLRNVARHSPTCISNIEIASLELQRFWGTAESSGTRITCEFWLMRRPRRTPVFGRRPTTLSTIPGTLRPPPPHPTMRRAPKEHATLALPSNHTGGFATIDPRHAGDTPQGSAYGSNSPHRAQASPARVGT